MSRARPGYRAATIFLTPADETAAAELAEALGLPPARRWARRADLTGLTGAIVAALRLAAACAKANPTAARMALWPGALPDDRLDLEVPVASPHRVLQLVRVAPRGGRD